MTLTLTLDPRTEADLQAMSAREGTDASQLTARLLARAARPRPVYGIARLKAYAAENEAEELALAGCGSPSGVSIPDTTDNGPL